MLKTYQGFGLPGSEWLAYTLEYRCPRCGSENVEIDKSELFGPSFCDGGPSTADELRDWDCTDCNYRAKGKEFVVGGRQPLQDNN
jgi:DNA-directed RNA polymerase subunit RPC12/RpoP